MYVSYICKKTTFVNNLMDIFNKQFKVWVIRLVSFNTLLCFVSFYKIYSVLMEVNTKYEGKN